MNDAEIERLKGRLMAKREEVETSLKVSEESRAVVELDQTSVGRVSRIDALQAQQMALAAARQRKDELARIEAALGRIADGSFGECIACGEDIPPKRLAFDPSVATCVTCAAGVRR